MLTPSRFKQCFIAAGIKARLITDPDAIAPSTTSNWSALAKALNCGNGKGKAGGEWAAIIEALRSEFVKLCAASRKAAR